MGKTPWFRLFHKPVKTASDWIERVHIALEVCGYAHVPHQANVDPRTIINEDIECTSASMGLNFRNKHIEPEVVFGGEKPKKQKKVIAKYVWSSML